jgi:hypothetical protein
MYHKIKLFNVLKSCPGMAIGLNLRGDARVCAAWGVVTGEPTVPEAHRQREALLNGEGRQCFASRSSCTHLNFRKRGVTRSIKLGGSEALESEQLKSTGELMTSSKRQIQRCPPRRASSLLGRCSAWAFFLKEEEAH